MNLRDMIKQKMRDGGIDHAAAVRLVIMVYSPFDPILDARASRVESIQLLRPVTAADQADADKQVWHAIRADSLVGSQD